MDKSTSKKVLSNATLEVDKNEWKNLYNSSVDFIYKYEKYLQWIEEIAASRKKFLKKPNDSTFEDATKGNQIKNSTIFYTVLLAYEKQINKFFNRDIKIGLVFKNGDIAIINDDQAKSLYKEAGKISRTTKDDQKISLGQGELSFVKRKKKKPGIDSLAQDEEIKQALRDSLKAKKKYYKKALLRTHIYEINSEISDKIYRISQSSTNNPQRTVWQRRSLGKNINKDKKNGTYISIKEKNQIEYWLLQGNGGQLSEGYFNWVLDGAKDKKLELPQIKNQIDMTHRKIGDVDAVIFSFWEEYVHNKKDNIKAIVRGDIKLDNFFTTQNLHISVKGGHNIFGLESPLQFFRFAVMISAIGESYPEELNFSEQTINTFAKISVKKAKDLSEEKIQDMIQTAINKAKK